MKRSLKLSDFIESTKQRNIGDPRIDMPSVGDNVTYEGRVWRIAYVSEVRDLILLEE